MPVIIATSSTTTVGTAQSHDNTNSAAAGRSDRPRSRGGGGGGGVAGRHRVRVAAKSSPETRDVASLPAVQRERSAHGETRRSSVLDGVRWWGRAKHSWLDKPSSSSPKAAPAVKKGRTQSYSARTTNPRSTRRTLSHDVEIVCDIGAIAAQVNVLSMRRESDEGERRRRRSKEDETVAARRREEDDRRRGDDDRAAHDARRHSDEENKLRHSLASLTTSFAGRDRISAFRKGTAAGATFAEERGDAVTLRDFRAKQRNLAAAVTNVRQAISNGRGLESILTSPRSAHQQQYRKRASPVLMPLASPSTGVSSSGGAVTSATDISATGAQLDTSTRRVDTRRIDTLPLSPADKDEVAAFILELDKGDRTAAIKAVSTELACCGFSGTSVGSVRVWCTARRKHGSGSQGTSQRGVRPMVSSTRLVGVLRTIRERQRIGNAAGVSAVGGMLVGAAVLTAVDDGSSMFAAATSGGTTQSDMLAIRTQTVTTRATQDNTKTRIEGKHDVANAVSSALLFDYGRSGAWVPTMTEESARANPVHDGLSFNFDFTTIVCNAFRDGHMNFHFVWKGDEAEAIKSKDDKVTMDCLRIKLGVVSDAAGGCDGGLIVQKLKAHDKTDVSGKTTPRICMCRLDGFSAAGPHAFKEQCFAIFFAKEGVSEREIMSKYYSDIFSPLLIARRKRIAEIVGSDYDGMPASAIPDELRALFFMDGELAQLQAISDNWGAGAKFEDQKILMGKLAAACSGWTQACDVAKSFLMLKRGVKEAEKAAADAIARRAAELAGMKGRVNPALIELWKERPLVEGGDAWKSHPAAIAVTRLLKENGIALQKAVLLKRALARLAAEAPHAFAAPVVTMAWQKIGFTPCDKLVVLQQSGQWDPRDKDGLSDAQKVALFEAWPALQREFASQGSTKDASIASLAPVSRFRRKPLQPRESAFVNHRRAIVFSHESQRAERDKRDATQAAKKVAAAATAKKKVAKRAAAAKESATLGKEVWPDVAKAGFVVVTPLNIEGKMRSGRLMSKYVVGLLELHGVKRAPGSSAAALAAQLEPFLQRARAAAACMGAAAAVAVAAAAAAETAAATAAAESDDEDL